MIPFMADTRVKKTKIPTTGYRFECLDGATVKKCFEQSGAMGLRDLVKVLRTDAEMLTRLADAIDSGEAYAFQRDHICTWAGWG